MQYVQGLVWVYFPGEPSFLFVYLAYSVSFICFGVTLALLNVTPLSA